MAAIIPVAKRFIDTPPLAVRSNSKYASLQSPLLTAARFMNGSLCIDEFAVLTVRDANQSTNPSRLSCRAKLGLCSVADRPKPSQGSQGDRVISICIVCIDLQEQSALRPLDDAAPVVVATPDLQVQLVVGVVRDISDPRKTSINTVCEGENARNRTIRAFQPTPFWRAFGS